MEATRIAIMMAFAIIIGVFFLIQTTQIINPFMDSGPLTLSDTIALYIDTFSSVESGTARIILTPGSVESIEVKFEEKGKNEDYRINRDGWHVVVSYKVSGKVQKSASRINSLPYSLGAHKTIFAPTSVCVIKAAEKTYPEVEKC